MLTQSHECLSPIPMNTYAFPMNDVVLWKAETEDGLDCPNTAGDNYCLAKHTCNWHEPRGVSISYDIRLDVFLNNEADRDLLVEFLEIAIEAYRDTVVARRSHDDRTIETTAA